MAPHSLINIEMAISQIDLEIGLDGEFGIFCFSLPLKYRSAFQDNINEWEIISAPEQNHENGTCLVTVAGPVNNLTKWGDRTNQ